MLVSVYSSSKLEELDDGDFVEGKFGRSWHLYPTNWNPGHSLAVGRLCCSTDWLFVLRAVPDWLSARWSLAWFCLRLSCNDAVDTTSNTRRAAEHLSTSSHCFQTKCCQVCTTHLSTVTGWT